jgi:hypothetical protein
MSFCEKAFVLSFYFLLRYNELVEQNGNLDNFYFNAIRETVRQGGDTDTNAAIVGSMLGALVGFKQIPEYMVKKTLDFDCTKEGRKRPEYLSVQKYGITNMCKLLTDLPK